MNGRVTHLAQWTLCGVALAVALVLAFNGLKTSPEVLTNELEEVQGLLSRGEYVAAESRATQLTARLRRPEEPDSMEGLRALDLVVLARARNGKANEPDTVELSQRVVRLKESLFGQLHHEVAVSLHNLGAVHVERGEFAAALDAHERALGIHTALYGPDHEATITSLEYAAIPEILLGRFSLAERKLEPVAAARELRAEEAPLALARTLQWKALLYRQSGRYPEAMQHVQRGLALHARHALDHPDTLQVLEIQGDLLFLQGDLEGARQAWSKGLLSSERTLGPDHPALSPFLRRLAGAADAVGHRAENKQLLARATVIASRRFAPCQAEAVWLLSDLAQSKSRDGDFAEAQRLHERALATIDQCRSPANSRATVLHNYALLAADMGDLAQAERLHEDAVDTWSKSLGPTHAYVARGIDALAEVVAARGDPVRARSLYERALAIRRQASPGDRPDVAWTLTNIARTIAASGDPSLALRYVEQAIAIYQRAGAFDDPDHFARAVELRGTLEARRGQLSAARASVTQALDERTRIFGSAHPLVAQTRAVLAQVELARGDYPAALGAALEAETAGRDHLIYTVRYLPERQAMSYAARRARGLDLALTIAANGSLNDPTAVLDAVIRSRGVILDELASRRPVTADPDPAVARLVAAATTSRQRFANLVVRSLEEPVARQVLSEARKQKEDAERALAERSVEADAELTRLSAGLAEVRRALPSGAALVSFVRYDRAERPADGGPGPARPPASSYAAFVVRAGTAPIAFIPLGPAAGVDAAITAWRHEASGQSIADGIPAARAERDYRATSMRVRQALWDPLRGSIDGAIRVFVVPDGLVNLVNLVALSDGDGYLAEREPVIHYLTTERDLLLPAREARAPNGLLAVGGAVFDGGPRTSTASRRGADCQSLAGVRFEPLPGSLSEVNEVGRLWPRSSGSDVTALVGAAATETAVKRAVGGRRVVHLATHGFFLDGACAPAMPGVRAVGGLVPASGLSDVAEENPLLLTGLALAGANTRGTATTGQDDGLLTAEEIAGFNLDGTEWAVLSACGTGLGRIKDGEGVFGLRRAFQIAGARTVIMSLWSVEDESTRDWMRALYEARLLRKLDTAAAVREADLSVLRARRSKGRSTHPFYWAAFVAAGDWR